MYVLLYEYMQVYHDLREGREGEGWEVDGEVLVCDSGLAADKNPFDVQRETQKGKTDIKLLQSVKLDMHTMRARDLVENSVLSGKTRKNNPLWYRVPMITSNNRE